MIFLFLLVFVFLSSTLVSRDFIPFLREAKSLNKVSVFVGLKFIIFPLESKVNLFESIIFVLLSSLFSLLIVIFFIIAFFLLLFLFSFFLLQFPFLMIQLQEETIYQN